MTYEPTNSEQMELQFRALKQSFNLNPYPAIEERVEVLKNLKAALVNNETVIYEALCKDYGYRSEFDSLLADVLPSVSAINYALKNIKKWMKPSRRHSGLILAPSKVRVHYQPLGVVGVITPWNFPIFLALGPAIQAIAAGNRVLIKMSRTTPNTNELLKIILSDLSNHIQIVAGESISGSAFSKLPFDHIIFTGSSGVGSQVAAVAGKNLTPVTLELGGKSPVVIDEEANLDTAIDAILFGKTLNSGQVCVAPDYVLAHETRKDEFIALFLKRFSEYYLKDKNKNKQTHIVSDGQLATLNALLDDAESKGAKIHTINDGYSSDGRRLLPHLITNTNDDMLIAQEEIFGSILPVLSYTKIEEAISYINERPRPLALYVMSKRSQIIEKIIKNTHSGGVAINDTVNHVAADDAPFGGVGNSGMGHYHGHEGFLTFSKSKTVLYSSSWIPKNKFTIVNRDLVFKLLRTFFLR